MPPSEPSTQQSSRLITFVPAIAMVVTLVGVVIGNGLLGSEESVGEEGSIASTQTLITPAGPAFSIWSLIYLFLFAYVIWQALPAGSRSARAPSVIAPAVASLVLNAAWIVVVLQVGSAWGSVAVMVLLVASLVVLHRRLRASAPESTAERWVLDIGFGLYLGWINVATAANITFALVLSDVTPAADVAVPIAIGVLVAVVAVAAYVVRGVSEPLAVGAAMAWGLAWICVDRLGTEPESMAVAVAAGVAAVAVVGLALWAAARPARSA